VRRILVLALPLVLVACGGSGERPSQRNGALVFTRGSLVAVLTPSGAVRELGPGLNPAWSSDGRRIAYERVDGGLWVMDANGANRRRLTRNPFDEHPSWSPDGRRIVFDGAAADAPVTSHVLWVVDADGSGRRRLGRTTTEPGGNLEPAWSPDGGRILYVLEERAGFDPFGNIVFSTILRTISPNGDVDAAVEPETSGHDPDWSPDGKQIVFEVDEAIWLRDEDGGLRRLARGRNPAWSPDAEWIVFERKGLWRVRVDGSDPERITQSADDYAPDWAPLGR
jgi:Tol biopolymer transport system component